MPNDSRDKQSTSSRQPPRAPTLVEVARVAGVSNTTVSYVLNGLAEKHGITEATAKHVGNVAKEMNYRPNRWARNLVTRRTRTIGALFGNLTNDWAERASVGMRQVLDDEGYLLFLTTHHLDSEVEQHELDTLLQLQVEAIICLALPTSVQAYRSLITHNTPLVFLENKLEELPEASSVVWNGEQAAYNGVRHLVETGRRRIAFLGREYPVGTEKGAYVPWLHSVRYQGYRRALQDAGLPVANLQEEYVLREEPTRSKVRKMFSKKAAQPDAIFAALDMLALGAIRNVKELGLRVPEDVAVVGMGDQPAGGELGAGLTTVRSPDEALGREAAKVALRLIRHPEEAPIRRMIDSNELVVRRTSVVTPVAEVV